MEKELLSDLWHLEKYTAICFNCEKNLIIGDIVSSLEDTKNYTRFAVLCQDCYIKEGK